MKWSGETGTLLGSPAGSSGAGCHGSADRRPAGLQSDGVVD